MGKARHGASHSQSRSIASCLPKLREKGIDFEQLVLVYRAPVSSETRRAIHEKARELKVVADPRDASYLVGELGKHPDIYKRFFAPLNMPRNSKTSLTPKLRFPEFQNAPDWEPVSLGDASVPVEERVGDRKLTPVSISAGIGFVSQAAKFGRDISGNQYKVYTVARDGDFVYNKGNSLKFPQGCVYQLRGWGEVAAPNVFICFRLKKGYSDGFFQSCFEKNDHGIQLKRHITSGARSNGLLNISRDTFFSVAIPTPSLAEQQKIAECLGSVDELIGAESQKIDALKDHKKGLMQQLFPRESETLPRLRFPEFQSAPEWKEMKLGDLVEIRSGNSPSQHNLSTSGRHAFVKVEDLNNCIKYQVTAREYSDDTDGVIPSGSVLFPKRGAAIELNKVRLSAHPLLADTNMMALTPRNECEPEFLYYFLSCVGLSKIADSSTIPQINNKHIIPFKITIPRPTEQHRIATCLSSLDDLIAAQSDRLKTLQTHKQGLMQQLFPFPAEANE